MRSLLLLGLLLSGCMRSVEPEPRPPSAERPPAAEPAPAPQEDAACQTDDDCALTRVPEGDCCELLCAPRAITRDRERELAASVRECARGGRVCPLPSCAPRPFHLVATCQAGQCALRRVRQQTE